MRVARTPRVISDTTEIHRSANRGYARPVRAESDSIIGQPRNALGVPAFRQLWLNAISFYMVANALRFVYGWVALDGLGENESVQGLVVFSLGLPGIVLLLPAGVWADRLDRRRLLIGTQLATAAVMATTAIALGSGRLSLAVVIASALLAGVTTALGSPVRSSMVPELLPRSLLFSGIALNALAMTASLVVGTVTAQVAGDAFGFDGAFWYLTLLLAAGTVAVVRMRPPATRRPTTRTTMRQAVGEGLRFVVSHGALRTLFLMLGMSGLIMNALMFVTLQAFVKEELGRDAGDAAPLLAVLGLGLAASSTVVMRRGDMADKGTVFLRAMLVGTTCLVLMGRATAYWQLFVLAVVMGMAGGFFINMNQGLVQANTPDELMGRVMGLYTLVQSGLTPFGALLIGLLATAIGPADAMTLCAGFAFVVTLAVYLTANELRSLKT